MKIIDLSEEHEPLYFVCLEDWSDEMKEAGQHKEIWYNEMKDKGLRVKLAVDDNGQVGGMIQYIPIEESFVMGQDLYFVYCIWVHGKKEGRGNFQKQGMGKALLRAAEKDTRSLGAKGLVTWGVTIPVFMRAGWFLRQGYKRVDRQGIQLLMWKVFDDSAEPPQWVRAQKRGEKTSSKVNVTLLKNGWCPAMNMVYERAKRAVTGFQDMVDLVEIETRNREIFWEWGVSDALFIDGKEMRLGPPPSYEKIEKKIRKRVKKLKT